ncbi:hypothetical protein Kisp01_35540 [Kineosporia sp. NBRC 101677]|uniref:RCC1 domain-containing protein n=1 Tax=Kineosporia sp. NBRC 101677 TaxID=3032197 RepID=UPI0024A3C0B4|nr:hypothetical protein [Kineosporia sp. NBRC 101677]GLY16539.1 hypothetical protein Kisp01_35540 [Kineosporia sp. NBRC 101677]
MRGPQVAARRWAVITVTCLVLLTFAALLPGRVEAGFTGSTPASAAFGSAYWIPVSSVSWAGDNQSGSAGETGIVGDSVAGRSANAVDDPGTFSALATGYHHSCAIRSSTVSGQPPGTLVCWGRNSGGQLGRGSTFTLQATPREITPSGTTWKALTGGSETTCALQSSPTDGSIWCWGWGGLGQLGNGGSPLQQTVPARIVSTGGVPGTWQSLSGDGDRNCAIAQDGGLWCWGRNVDGEVGDGTTASRSTPTRIESGATFSSVASGQLHTCAVAAGGTVQGAAVQPGQAYCWGKNDYLQLGTGSTAASQTTMAPVLAAGSTGVRNWASLASGSRSTCGITAATGDATKPGGQLWCWGQLGDGGANTSAPQQVGTSTGWSAIDAGGDGTTTFCGIEGGALSCRGGNVQGLAGDGTILYRTAWGAVGNSTGTTWSQVSVARSHSCALSTAGTVFCWGSAEFGQPGTGLAWFRNTLRDTNTGAGRWSSLDSEENHACALRGLDLFCWGKNTTGQLGQGDYVSHGTPQQVSGSWEEVSVGSDHTCAIATTGAAWCWGRNLSGASLGTANAGTQNTPGAVVVTGVTGDRWLSLDTGQNATCGIRSDHSLWCWGAQSSGVLGNGTPNVSLNRPTQVSGGGNDWMSVQVSSNEHACATKRNDTALYCWGNNANGQAGTGTSGGNVPTPRAITRPAAVTGAWKSYAVGHDHSCGVDAAGTLWCWGRNNDRQFGTPANTADSATPVIAAAPASGTTWTSVTAGGNSTCATRSDGGLWCWGHNWRGKLGLGSDNATIATPTQTSATTPTATHLSRVSIWLLR